MPFVRYLALAQHSTFHIYLQINFCMRVSVSFNLMFVRYIASHYYLFGWSYRIEVVDMVKHIVFTTVVLDPADRHI